MRTAMQALIFLVISPLMQAQPATPQTPADHHAGVNNRGDEAMGFPHAKTTHHFRLFKDGGAIEVESNDPNDTKSRDDIRMHLEHISRAFAAGNFNIPMFIHATSPPGAATMAELRDQIRYQYQETDSGARVRIRTANSRGVKAIHDFLRFQISDHQTGDSLKVSEDTR
jgi:hypothetical protein